MHWSSVLALFMMLVVEPVAARAQSLWQGESGGFRVQWTTANLEARRSGAANSSFDARALASKKWAEITHGSKSDGYSLDYDYKLLSQVGTIMSLEQGEECDCGGAHPSALTTFLAIDLPKSGPTSPVSLSLTDLFSPASVYSSLMKDSVVQAALAGKKPASLDDLMQSLENDGAYKLKDCTYGFDADFLKHFAFYDYQAGTATVRLSLSHIVESCRGNMIQIGIELPVTDSSLQAALTSAKEGRQGVLMHDMPRKAPKDAVTKLSFPRNTSSK